MGLRVIFEGGFHDSELVFVLIEAASSNRGE